MIFAEFGTGQVFWSMLWFFLFFIWIWMLIVVFGDIFRSPDLSGWGKALWTIFVIFLPYLGVFVYLIARGNKMQQHTIEAAQAQDAALRQYVQQVAAPSGAAPPTRSPGWRPCATRAYSARRSSSKPRRRRCPDRASCHHLERKRLSSDRHGLRVPAIQWPSSQLEGNDADADGGGRSGIRPGVRPTN